MDANSTDNTVKILEDYGERITWKSEKDNGQADAVNKGVNLARGEIIGWLNSDDVYVEGTIKKVSTFFLTHPEIDVLYGNGYFINEHSNIIGCYPTKPFDSKMLAKTCFISQPTVFFRKSAFEKVGGLNTDLHLCMDYEFWIRLSFEVKFAHLNQFFASTRMYGDTKTLSRRSEVHREVCDVLKKHYDYVPLHWLEAYVMYLYKDKLNPIKHLAILIKFILKYNPPYPKNIMNMSYEIVEFGYSKIKKYIFVKGD